MPYADTRFMGQAIGLSEDAQVDTRKRAISSTRVHWNEPAAEIVDDTVKQHSVPSAYDAAIHRRRGSTISMPITPGIYTDQHEPFRGRSLLRRPTIIIPDRQRALSPHIAKRRPAPDILKISDTKDEHSLIAGKQTTVVASSVDASHHQLFDLDLIAKDSPAGIETISSEEGTDEDQSGTDSPRSSGSYFAANLRATSSPHSGGPESTTSPAASIFVNTTPFELQSTYTRLSISDFHFKQHRDTFALLRLPKKRYSIIGKGFGQCSAAEKHRRPLMAMALAAPFLDSDSWCNVRLTCHAWNSVVTFNKPPSLPAVYFMPQKLIGDILRCLSPSDFEAARRTCRSWRLASFDKDILKAMVVRSG